MVDAAGGNKDGAGTVRWRACGGGAMVARAEWLDAAAALPAGSVDLVYADPPFNTGAAKVGRAGRYGDSFGSGEAHAAWLLPRVVALKRVLSARGSVVVHVDWRSSHRARMVLEEVFGEACFVNHLVWSYGLGGSGPRAFARKHDDLLWYSARAGGHYFDPPRVPATSARMKGRMKKATDVIAIPAINNMARERTGYPTQKPLALLELLVGACCPPGGTVFDPCCGSGTALLAAVALGRKAFGSDVSPAAVKVAESRLVGGG
jgi:DNA modification methylase